MMRRNKPQYILHISHYSQILESSLQLIKSGSHLKPNVCHHVTELLFLLVFTNIPTISVSAVQISRLIILHAYL